MTTYLLNLADLFLTLHALQHGGVELNPFMQDPDRMVQHKAGTVFILCLMLECIARGKVTDNLTTQNAARWGLRLCAAAFAAACINNLIFIIFGGA